MITKLKSIQRLAVFQDFDWDKSVKGKDGSVQELKEINILYGRNYSGKTTLSRILRAFETGCISDKFKGAAFTLQMKDQSVLEQSKLTGHGHEIRVFNEDFVRENLRFIANPNERIVPFAVIGKDNVEIEGAIKKLEEELGVNEAGKETCMYGEQIALKAAYATSSQAHSHASNSLNDKLSQKATHNPTGMKHNASLFGDINYNITKLNADIHKVLLPNFSPISDNEKLRLLTLIDEKTNPETLTPHKINLSFSQLRKTAGDLVKKHIAKSSKIDELVEDALLNQWAKQGKELHSDHSKNCGFCGNIVSEKRWEALERHFDEESKELEGEIRTLMVQIDNEVQVLENGHGFIKDTFYTKYQEEFERVDGAFQQFSRRYTENCNILKLMHQEKQRDLFTIITAELPEDCSSEFKALWTAFEELNILSNDYTSRLAGEQKAAKESLRLREVYDFLNTIGYIDDFLNIEKLKQKNDDAKNNLEKVGSKISERLKEIEQLKEQLKDESGGAEKVNEYLANFFGHKYLTLKALNETDSGGKGIHFEVLRNGAKAYHLSEGECSLIAFCYFMARLNDKETKGKKPIIWIDDPISSLDSNHVFFVFSLIKTRIVTSECFEQLFVSTHNLDFFKYLKRLQPTRSKLNYRYLLVRRLFEGSTITPMPDYLKNYVSEFNFLFQQIYECASLEEIDDTNYQIYYNFGNNARKFLEIYLNYKYPDGDTNNDAEKMTRFFDGDEIPAVLGDRINNEYSHLAGGFERGSKPIEVPEMNQAAKMILKRLEVDKDQYSSLLKSIGISGSMEMEVPMQMQ